MNKPAKTPRAPGRPAAAATVQREQLLSIATDMFAQQGIQATRLRAIAERAGVTPALLNYYFGNKERLVEAMVEERFLPLVARAAAQLQQAGDDPLALVEAFIRDMVRNVTEQPWLSQLWVREILCEGGVLRERLMHRVAPMVPLLLAQKFAAAGCEVRFLTRFSALTQVAAAQGFIESEQLAMIQAWNQNPQAWGPLHGFPNANSV